MKRALAIVLAFVMMLSVFGSSAVSESAVSGTFTGTARAMKGDLTVEVDLDNGTITDVRVVDTVDTLGIKDAAIASVPKRIVEQQNIDVDAVTGATMTSNGLTDAINVWFAAYAKYFQGAAPAEKACCGEDCEGNCEDDEACENKEVEE